MPGGDDWSRAELRTALSAYLEVSADGKALGRPVGVAIGRGGALLVADDVGNKIWRVAPAAGGVAGVAP